MNSIFLILCWLIMSVGIFVLWYLYGIVSQDKNIPGITILKHYGTKRKKNQIVLSEKKQVVFLICSSLIILVNDIGLYHNQINILDWLKLSFVMWFLILLAVIDWVYHIIPNKILFLAFGIRLLLYILEFVFRKEVFRQILISSILGAVFGFGLLFIMALITRHALGYGDVKLFGVLGSFVGFVPTYNILLYSLVASSVVGLFLLVVRKKGRKYQMPFAPFVLIGYVAVVVLGMF